MPRVHRLQWIVLIAVVACAACGGRTEGKVRISEHVAAVNLDSTDTAVLDAKCAPSEQLVGGGYSMLEPPLSLGNPLIVEASFPVASGLWRTVVTRPESFEQERDGIPLAFSWAVCASIENRELETDVVEGPQATPPASGGSLESATTEATCPSGSVLTAGGFRVSPAGNDEWNVAGLFNAWIWSSDPVSETTWQVVLRRISGQQGPTPPSVRAYAVCAQPPIDSVRLVEAEAVKREPINFGYLDGAATCESTEVATGGGYRFAGDALVPHLVISSRAQLPDGSWSASAIHGHQTGSEAGFSVSAACVPIPVVVDVGILKPKGEVCDTCTVQVEFPVRVTADPSKPQLSVPIEFQAMATDGQGDPLTGNALVWTAYTDPNSAGTALGTGESFTARLPAPAGGESTVGYLVEVVASDDEGNTASDSVVVIVEAGP